MTELPHHPTCKATNPQILAELKAAMSRVPPLKEVRFPPWVGKHYVQNSASGSKRILIMDESDYEWCERCRQDGTKRDADLTPYCIAERVTLIEAWPDPLQQHWTKIENAFLGFTAHTSARREFWHSVTYYNFLQETVGFGPRVPVKSDLWGKAQ